jgi:L-rhamnose mutarotase
MKYYGLTINLKDDTKVIETYKEYHRHVWPEVEASHRASIARTRIFLLGQRMFMYMEVTDSFDESNYLQVYMQEPKAVEWEKLMIQFMEAVPEAKPGEVWARMEPIYALE